MEQKLLPTKCMSVDEKKIGDCIYSFLLLTLRNWLSARVKMYCQRYFCIDFICRCFVDFVCLFC